MSDALATYWENRVDADFFRQDVHALASSLLGKLLVRWDGNDLRAARLVEVEAYGGTDDPACHGNSGEPTDRTRPMFARGGRSYVYLIYGMHHCFNIVADPGGIASAVLVRAAEPIVGEALMARRRGRKAPTTPKQRWHLLSGPGKLCQALDITRDAFNDVSLTTERLFISTAGSSESIAVQSTRIGLNRKTCGDAVDWPWRYVVGDSPFLSKPP